MDNFKAIYKILSVLENSMDYPQVDIDRISPETLGVSHERWNKYMEMMYDIGYIKGVSIRKYADGDRIISLDDIQITLEGLEYLQENSTMRKIYNATKGIKEIVPGL